jgi:acyl-CoA thioesterase FadM
LKVTKADNKYTTRFQIRSYEVDGTGETSMPTICNLFQESAGLHAFELNFDISDLFKKGLTWILYQLHVKIEKFPKRWDDVMVKTCLLPVTESVHSEIMSFLLIMEKSLPLV